MEGGPSLTELVAAAREGDQAAWDEIVARFTSLLWSVARSYRLEHNAAADAVQGTWLRLVESINSLHDPEALPGWLLTTARRQSIRLVRGKVRDIPVDDVDLLDPEPLGSPSLDSALLLDERDAALWQAFCRLGERCQRLLRVLMAPELPAIRRGRDPARYAGGLDRPHPRPVLGPAARAACGVRLRLRSEPRGEPP